MIVIDTSAIVAIFLGEPEAESLALAIASDPAPLLSAASFVEASMVLLGRTVSAETWLDDFVTVSGITIEPVTHEHARIARDAYFRFGKGRHPAGLNFGDCFAYALAKAVGAPLLFKGNDFGQTDIALAG